MSDLAARLAGLDRASQVKVVREEGPSASAEELISTLRAAPLWVVSDLVRELAQKGAGACGAIEQALLANPLSPSAGALAEALIQLHEREPEVGSRVVAVLVRAASASLGAGAGSAGLPR